MIEGRNHRLLLLKHNCPEISHHGYGSFFIFFCCCSLALITHTDRECVCKTGRFNHPHARENDRRWIKQKIKFLQPLVLVLFSICFCFSNKYNKEKKSRGGKSTNNSSSSSIPPTYRKNREELITAAGLLHFCRGEEFQSEIRKWR